MYHINNKEKKCSDLEKYSFRYEDSVQELLEDNPQILLNIDELGIPPFDDVIAIREYQSQRGPIDIVYITDNGDIILVETKLLKNSESHRAVVAQAIDYAKAFSSEDIESLKSKMKDKKNYSSLFNNNKNIEAILNKNISNGNYQVLIVGDEIHPNILGMVESIQSAPHLSFTLSAISLNPHKIINEEYMVFPRIESRTVEVERSVISIEVINNDVRINSSSPSIESKGNKPKITDEEFLENIERPEFIESIKYLWKEIEKRNGSIDWGTCGFSGGYRINNKRISLIWAYDKWINILTPKYKKSYDIPEDSYNLYLDDLKRSTYIYENIIVPNKSQVRFNSIEIEDCKVVIDAALNLMDRMTSKEELSI